MTNFLFECSEYLNWLNLVSVQAVALLFILIVLIHIEYRFPAIVISPIAFQIVPIIFIGVLLVGPTLPFILEPFEQAPLPEPVSTPLWIKEISNCLEEIGWSFQPSSNLNTLNWTWTIKPFHSLDFTLKYTTIIPLPTQSILNGLETNLINLKNTYIEIYEWGTTDLITDKLNQIIADHNYSIMDDYKAILKEIKLEFNEGTIDSEMERDLRTRFIDMRKEYSKLNGNTNRQWLWHDLLKNTPISLKIWYPWFQYPHYDFNGAKNSILEQNVRLAARRELLDILADDEHPVVYAHKSAHKAWIQTHIDRLVANGEITPYIEDAIYDEWQRLVNLEYSDRIISKTEWLVQAKWNRHSAYVSNSQLHSIYKSSYVYINKEIISPSKFNYIHDLFAPNRNIVLDSKCEWFNPKRDWTCCTCKPNKGHIFPNSMGHIRCNNCLSHLYSGYLKPSSTDSLTNYKYDIRAGGKKYYVPLKTDKKINNLHNMKHPYYNKSRYTSYRHPNWKYNFL